MNIKNENGITLVALVTTIVVMIILASIAISASVGDNGLIEQTSKAAVEASTREVEEALDAYLLLKEKDKIKNGDFTGVTINELEEDEIFDLTKTEIVEGETVNYTIYTITSKGLEKLNIKGEYGNTKGVFKIKVNENNEYEVIYED